MPLRKATSGPSSAGFHVKIVQVRKIRFEIYARPAIVKSVPSQYPVAAIPKYGSNLNIEVRPGLFTKKAFGARAMS